MTNLDFGEGSEDFRQAEWLSEQFKGTWRFDHGAGRWHHWDGVRWAPDRERVIYKAVADAARRRIANLSDDNTLLPTPSGDLGKALIKLLNVTSQEKALTALSSFPECSTDGTEWDKDPYLLGCKNGLVDLRTNTLIEHPNPTTLVTKTTKHDFAPISSWEEAGNVAPRFMRFLDEITSHDPELILFLVLWFGYSLLGENPEQKFLLMIGEGRNGKGKLKDAILEACGEYASQINPNMYMRINKHGGIQSNVPRADLLGLRGTRIVFCSDPEGGSFNEPMLKAHTGEDRIKARNLYDKVESEWAPTHNISFLVNNRPEVEDVGDSFRERVMVSDFRESYMVGTRQPPDLGLGKVLTREAAGVLAILCWAAWAWFSETKSPRLRMPERVWEQSRVFVEANDPVAQCINEAMDTADREVTCRTSLIYDAYLQWHMRMDRSGDPISGVKFSYAMERKHYKKIKRPDGMYYIGIRPKSALRIAEEEDDD